MKTQIAVYLESGDKRTFAGAIEWPGWCRSGGDEQSALQALIDYGPRYRQALRTARMGFKAPRAVSELKVIERLKGNTTTDFGAPAVAPAADGERLEGTELRRYEQILRACWRRFDEVVKRATGKRLRVGPRGGGRELAKIVDHVIGGDDVYLSALGWPFKRALRAAPGKQLLEIRDAILEGIVASARGEIPSRGPRGGKRWSARYFVRRSAWHVLDHAWEIEDRIVSQDGS